MDLASILRVWLPLFAGAFALGILYQRGIGPHDTLRLIGLVIAILGFFGVVAARYTLGRSFSIRAKATALVTTGIYSRIRNPIYVSGMFFVGGMILMLRRFELLALFLVLIPMQILRARREASVLEAKFGEEYREYRKQTWF